MIFGEDKKMNMHNPKVKRAVAILILVLIVAMVAGSVIPYLAQ